MAHEIRAELLAGTDELLPPAALWGLRLTRTVFEAECIAPLRLDDFVGNTLRGDFGFMLRHHACRAADKSECANGCAHNCVYGHLFAPRSAQGAKAVDAPRPYIIEPCDTLKTAYQPGEVFRFCLLLIGQAQESLDFLTEVFEALGQRGLGEGHRVGLGRFTLAARHTQQITEQNFAARAAYLSALLAAPGSMLNLHLLRPTFINQARASGLAFLPFWNSLVTRCKNLSQVYGGVELDDCVTTGTFKALAQRAEAVQKTGDLLFVVPQQRYSGSQRRDVQAGGLVGSATFAGDLAPFLPLLSVAEWLHAGKDTVLGNGLLRLSVT